jgi:hypothetical protein
LEDKVFLIVKCYQTFFGSGQRRTDFYDRKNELEISLHVEEHHQYFDDEKKRSGIPNKKLLYYPERTDCVCGLIDKECH